MKFIAKLTRTGENKNVVIFKTGRFDNIDSAVIISSISKVVLMVTVLMVTVLMVTVLMVTAESTLSKGQVLKITVASFSFLSCFRLNFIAMQSEVDDTKITRRDTKITRREISVAFLKQVQI